MSIRTGYLGPVIDTNPVFDSNFVIAKPKTFTFSAERKGIYVERIYPGDSYIVDFTLNLTSWNSTDIIPSPYNVEIHSSGSPNTPIVYTDWIWGTICSNT